MLPTTTTVFGVLWLQGLLAHPRDVGRELESQDVCVRTSSFHDAMTSQTVLQGLVLRLS